MATKVQVTFDAADPSGLGTFWAHVLGYVEQPPPDGYATWDEFLDEKGMPPEQRDAGYAVVDPAGSGPRLFFQKVPEGKSAKNRVHLDVDVTGGAPRPEHAGRCRARAVELEALGATRLREFDDPVSGFWIVMTDPEGNEFCLV